MTVNFESFYPDFVQNRPRSADLVTTLLALETAAKREKITYPFAQLLGTWQLIFITGTQKAQKKAGAALGKGRYLPQWIKVAIAYTEAADNEPSLEWQKGTVLNSVEFGLLKLAVSGCIKFQSQKRLLAFDFIHFNLKLGGMQLYDGAMRGGSDTEAKFHATAIGKLAFFSYFYVSENLIAARGKGGGIALWQRII